MRKKLTPKELAILALAELGYHQREIAQKLGIARHTVSTHMTGVMVKYNVNTLFELGYERGKEQAADKEYERSMEQFARGCQR